MDAITTSNWINAGLLAVSLAVAVLGFVEARSAKHSNAAAEKHSRAAANALAQIADEVEAQSDADTQWVIAPPQDGDTAWTVTNWTGQVVFASLAFPRGAGNRLQHQTELDSVWDNKLRPGQSLFFLWAQHEDGAPLTARVDVMWWAEGKGTRIARLRAKRTDD